MRHLFRLPCPVTLLTNLVVHAAGFRLLVQSARGALLLRPHQGSTRRAIAVATVAPPTNHHLPMTTPAVENPVIFGAHPVSATQGLYRDRRKSDAPLGASQATGFTPLPLSRSLRGSGCCRTPTLAALEWLSHNPVHSATAGRRAHGGFMMPTPLPPHDYGGGPVMKGG